MPPASRKMIKCENCGFMSRTHIEVDEPMNTSQPAPAIPPEPTKEVPIERKLKSKYADLLNSLNEMQLSMLYAALRPVLAEAENLIADLERQVAALREVNILYDHAIKCVDTVFQKCKENPNPILPDFLGLGEDKFRGVIQLAKEYVKSRQQIPRLVEAGNKLIAESDAMRSHLIDRCEYEKDGILIEGYNIARKSFISEITGETAKEGK